MTTPASLPPSKPRRRHWGLIIFLIVIVLPVVGVSMYTMSTLNFVYSRGERAGFVQKISRAGWLCKTWEGQLAMVNLPGTVPEIFKFSVRDDSVAHLIEQSIGHRVALTYEQHAGVPTSCFGDTEYYITGLRPDAMQ